jgi:hypothetical protein
MSTMSIYKVLVADRAETNLFIKSSLTNSGTKNPRLYKVPCF